MPAAEALAAGAILSIVGIAYLAVTCNTFSAVIAAITVIIYIFAYTPLKRISNFNTLVGTVPGALPPVVGWVAARGRIDPGAWSLFAIMVLWQLPHFFAISWMCREDYSRAGFQMISNDDVRGDRSASQSVFFTMLLLVIAGLPAFVGVASQIYVPIELLLGACYVAVALQFLQKRTIRSARLLFLTSILYLPLLLGALVLTKL
jgi:protoheme IX farnesyltransferase